MSNYYSLEGRDFHGPVASAFVPKEFGMGLDKFPDLESVNQLPFALRTTSKKIFITGVPLSKASVTQNFN